MKFWMLCIFSLLVMQVARADGPTIKSKEDSWIDLTYQPSRKELFHEKIAETAEEYKAAHPIIVNPQSFNIPKNFLFPHDAKFDDIRNKPRAASVFGIDISHFEDESLNLKLLSAQGIGFVYTKATQGTNFKDPKFGFFWNGLDHLDLSNKPARGAYHFLDALESGRDQAERFVAYVNLHGGFKKGDMPPCVDLEWDVTKTNPDQWKGQSPDKIIGSVIDWLTTTEKLTGRKPIVYTSPTWWAERGIPNSKFALLKPYYIWIADYSDSHKAVETPALIDGSTQTIWQFTDDAKLNLGYKKGLDANIFYGSQSNFRKMFQLDS